MGNKLEEWKTTESLRDGLLEDSVRRIKTGIFTEWRDKKKSTYKQRHYGYNQHEKTHMVWTRPKNARRTVAQKGVGLGTKQENVQQ